MSAKDKCKATLSSVLNRLLPGNARTPGYIAAVLSGYGVVAATMAVQIVLVPVYMSALGRAQFGFLMFVLAGVNFAAFGIGWMSGGSVRVLGECFAHGDNRGFWKSTWFMRLVFAAYSAAISVIVLVLAFIPGSPLIERFTEIPAWELKKTIALTAVYLVVYYDFAALRQALIAIGRQDRANYATALSLLVFALFVVPWLLLYKGGLAGVVSGLIGGAFAARWLAAEWLYRIGPPRPQSGAAGEESPEILRSLIGKTGMGYAAYGALLLILQSDVVIVGWLGGASVVAEFVLIWKIADVVVLALWRIPNSLHPYIVHLYTKNEWRDLRDLYNRTLLRMSIVGAVAALGYAFFGNLVVQLWVGANQAPEGILGFWLAGACVFFLVISRVPAIFLYAVARLKSLVTVLAVEVSLKLVGTVLLFPYVGYWAPLIAFASIHLAGATIWYQWLGYTLVSSEAENSSLTNPRVDSVP